ncbi:aromatic ring-hydroxylating oxygenase subunit alpha [Ilumatobacter coccineus]|uniref:Putative iron-sulfur protein n=1 Tax=Ilumatobacter coccineus (strain NBRC 103263 / KCTC 29153 / YM16-304) TaxID=1313172 RepID=A0A6C7E9J3_ILUCY|nr:aromatic ring-hydroxylating dioxygenase subunit alpha [Ilumatobacter coccineus]BAN04324.1 putative iron-sulfur protein [Ilumatobacter coccineus YM16-304]
MQHLVDNTWYAIHRSSALGRRPVTVERLGRRLVVWRTRDGVHAAPAQCPHRGADLGAGKVVDGCLTCPYHGIGYTADGSVATRPAMGANDDVPADANLRTLPTVDAHGYIWVWHGDLSPLDGPEWFDVEEPTATVGDDQVWDVHYSRFMESALDFHHVPFVHGAYTPGIGRELTDVELIDDGTRLSMTAKLTNASSGRSIAVAGEVVMPCALRVRIGSTEFVAVGTPVDDDRTWVAANYHPSYTKRIPGLRVVEAWLAMFVDFKLFQRQDRSIFEGLGSAPSPLERMALMPADTGSELWIRRWREMLGGDGSDGSDRSDRPGPAPAVSGLSAGAEVDQPVAVR